MTHLEATSIADTGQYGLYEQAASAYGAALDRLARSYEADPHTREDLIQEIHLALWRSLAGFDGRASLRTWVYRVAHNVATSHVIRDRRHNAQTWVSLDALETMRHGDDAEAAADRQLMLEQLQAIIQRLNPPDRQLMLLYLEGLDAASIGEITGLSASNVATKIHRIKKIIAERARRGESHGG